MCFWEYFGQCPILILRIFGQSGTTCKTRFPDHWSALFSTNKGSTLGRGILVLESSFPQRWVNSQFGIWKQYQSRMVAHPWSVGIGPKVTPISFLSERLTQLSYFFYRKGRRVSRICWPEKLPKALGNSTAWSRFFLGHNHVGYENPAKVPSDKPSLFYPTTRNGWLLCVIKEHADEKMSFSMKSFFPHKDHLVPHLWQNQHQQKYKI